MVRSQSHKSSANTFAMRICRRQSDYLKSHSIYGDHRTSSGAGYGCFILNPNSAILQSNFPTAINTQRVTREPYRSIWGTIFCIHIIGTNCPKAVLCENKGQNTRKVGGKVAINPQGFTQSGQLQL